jgi:hypothetical protein
MGMILEFYRLSDEKITELRNLPERSYVDYLQDNYASVFGSQHKENDTVFSLDKTWDVIKFLIVEADTTVDKALKELYGEPLTENYYDGYNYLFSEKVKTINELLQEIQTKDLYSFYDDEKMERQSIYKTLGFHWSFLEKQIEIVKLAFQKAAATNCGLIISIG